MTTKTLVGCALLMIASACGSDDASDAAKDASLPDATQDVAAEAPADTGVADGPADASSDASAPDASAEASADADAGWGCTEVAHIGDSLTAYTIDPNNPMTYEVVNTRLLALHLYIMRLPEFQLG